jgi:hypothetical protein
VTVPKVKWSAVQKIIMLNLAGHMKMTVMENVGYIVTAGKSNIIKLARTC